MTKTITSISKTEHQQTIDLLCLAAQIILESGGETYRVEETATRMAKGLGLEEINVVVFPTSIYIESEGYTGIRRVVNRGTNTGKIAEVNDISRRVERGELTKEETEKRLYEITMEKGEKRSLLIIGFGISAACFSLLFGGNLQTFFVTFLIGVVIELLEPLTRNITMGQIYGHIIGGCVAAMMACGFHAVISPVNISAAIIGGIMPLLSGILMTMAARDIMYGDLISGMARALEGLLMAASVAIGVFIGLYLMSGIGGVN